MSVSAPKTIVATYSLRRSVRNLSNLVPLPIPNTRTPVAGGSRVPEWPTFFVPKIPRLRYDIVTGPPSLLINNCKSVFIRLKIHFSASFLLLLSQREFRQFCCLKLLQGQGKIQAQEHVGSLLGPL